jgi:hypothetical protein
MPHAKVLKESGKNVRPALTIFKAHLFPSLYVKMLTSPLDQGPEQEKTCSIDLPGKDLLLHTA